MKKINKLWPFCLIMICGVLISCYGQNDNTIVPDKFDEKSSSSYLQEQSAVIVNCEVDAENNMLIMVFNNGKASINFWCSLEWFERKDNLGWGEIVPDITRKQTIMGKAKIVYSTLKPNKSMKILWNYKTFYGSSYDHFPGRKSGVVETYRIKVTTGDMNYANLHRFFSNEVMFKPKD